jgi:two-component system cell cycle sensor histidine kinase PleC
MDMINDILDMARIEAGKFNLNLKPLDPTIAIEQALRLMRGRAEEKSLALNLDAVDPPEITADHRALKQIALNLLSNALKFTQAGGVQVRMRRGEHGGLLLQVADTGPGIAPDALKRLGQPFEQAHAGDADLSRAHSGTGLGLAITKTLVELHGGTFDIRSVLGQGTVVTIRLPPEPPPREGEAAPEERPLNARLRA